MLYALLTLFLLVCTTLPMVWVRYVMRKYSKDIGLPGTGGQLANHLVKRFELNTNIETCDPGKDHFDPASNTVRLSPSNFDGKSLTSIAVAAHEIGHAIQFHRREKIFELRGKYIPIAVRLKKIGGWLAVSMPIITMLVRSPAVFFLLIAIIVSIQILSALIYLIVLPEEWDASFNKALPILDSGNYVTKTQKKAVKRVLTAAALTYFAAAMVDVVNISRWLLILRR